MINLICKIFNAFIIGLLLYYLFTDFYKWEEHSVWLGQTEHSYSISSTFKIILMLALAVPVFLFFRTKKFGWLIQPVALTMILVTWKTDFMQRTLFYNQPCSVARETVLVKNFIENHEAVLLGISKQLNTLMRDSIGVNEHLTLTDDKGVSKNTDTLYVIDYANYKQYNKFKVTNLQKYFKLDDLNTQNFHINQVVFLRGKVYSMSLYPVFNNSDISHHLELYYYPEGFRDYEFSNYSHSKLGNNLMVTCQRKYYYHEKLWLLYFEGLCFG